MSDKFKRFLVLIFLLPPVVFALSGCDLAITKEQKVKKQVAGNLLDPESAKFEVVYKGNDDKHHCGYVNAKNRMGAYSGSTRFIHKTVTDDFGLVTLVPDAPSNSDFRRLMYTSDFDVVHKKLWNQCYQIAEWNKTCSAMKETQIESHNLCPLMIDENPKNKFITELYKLK